MLIMTTRGELHDTKTAEYYLPGANKETSQLKAGRQQMKIGIVSPYDWSYPGGVREHIRHLAEQFILLGHDVRVLAPGKETKGILAEKHLFYGMGKTAPLTFQWLDCPHRDRSYAFMACARYSTARAFRCIAYS